MCLGQASIEAWQILVIFITRFILFSRELHTKRKKNRPEKSA